MPDVMKSLPLSKEIKDALCLEQSDGNLAEQHQLCIAFERADWDYIEAFSNRSKITQDDLFSMYNESVAWADTMKPTFI